MARKKLKDFTSLELMLSALLLGVFIITIPLFVLSAKESLESKGNKELWYSPSTDCSYQSKHLIIHGREVMLPILCCECVCVGFMCVGHLTKTGSLVGIHCRPKFWHFISQLAQCRVPRFTHYVLAKFYRLLLVLLTIIMNNTLI